jgi:hypothetical protein
MKPLLLPTLLAIALAACTQDGGDKNAPEAPTTSVPATPGSMPPSTPAAAPKPAVESASAPGGAPADPAEEAEVDARIDQVLGNHVAYRHVLERLQTAVAGDDRSGVAALVRYPLKARTGAEVLRIGNAKAFVERYDDIVTPAVAKAIAGQRYAGLFVSQNGVMLGSGEVWINGICQDPKCVDVDVKVVAFQHGS